MVVLWLRGIDNNILLSHLWCSGWNVTFYLLRLISNKPALKERINKGSHVHFEVVSSGAK